MAAPYPARASCRPPGPRFKGAREAVIKRCAVYARKSSAERLDLGLNSLEAQRQSCESCIASQAGEGWVALDARCDDGGFSGGVQRRVRCLGAPTRPTTTRGGRVMELVSERSEKDLAAEHALAEVDDALCRLAANIMRVTAGAGEPYSLLRQSSDFATACLSYSDIVQHIPSSAAIYDMLRPGQDENLMAQLRDEQLREEEALKDIETGVLRAVAARLVGQRTQESNASHLIYKGVNAILALRRERDARLTEKRKAEAAATHKPRRTTKAKRVGASRKPERPAT